MKSGIIQLKIKTIQPINVTIFLKFKIYIVNIQQMFDIKKYFSTFLLKIFQRNLQLIGLENNKT